MSSKSGSSSPSAEPPNFQNIGADAMLAETDQILNTTLKLHDEMVATINAATASFDNVIRPIVDDENRAACRLIFLSEVLAQLSAEQGVRHAARQAERNVAALVSAVYTKKSATPSANFDAQDQHLLICMHRKYVHPGALLHSNEERDRFRQASNALSEICAAAQDTLVEPEEGLWFDREELTGVPQDVLETMIRKGSRVQVSFRRNHTGAVLRNAISSHARQRLLVADWHRLPDNVKRLSRAVELRDEIARMLGFQHHAGLRMQNRMAPSVAFVQSQPEDLHAELKPVALAETIRIAECKQRSIGEGQTLMVQLFDWDKAFYGRKLKEEESFVDLSHVAEYFEVYNTAFAMLDLFYEVFELCFERVEPPTWHDSVIALQVWDTPGEGGEFVGYLYLDLFQRQGKYRGAHCIGLQPGFIEHNGSTHYPATALVCCYSNPSVSRPTLLQHNEVVTMFHELGHAIHNLVSRAKYAIERSRDYSEIPSIMLENWTRSPDVLIRLGKHVSSLGDASKGIRALPRPLAETICATRQSNRANAVLAHVWPAMFDLAIHTPVTHTVALEMDTTHIWNATKQHVCTTSSGDSPDDWGAGQARFIHMFRHNDAGYFSYPLSIAYAADIFASKFAKDPMNPEAGRKWRYQVLEAGAGLLELDILKEYLGREPGIKAIIDEMKATMKVLTPSSTGSR